MRKKKKSNLIQFSQEGKTELSDRGSHFGISGEVGLADSQSGHRLPSVRGSICPGGGCNLLEMLS